VKAWVLEKPGGLPEGVLVQREVERPTAGEGEILVRVGDPIDTAGLKGSPGRKELTRLTREALIALGVPDGSAGPEDQD